MINASKNTPRLFVAYLCSAFGLGYSSLQRFYPPHTGGLGDSWSYFAIAEGRIAEAGERFQGRRLVPTLARIIRARLPEHLGGWDRTSFAMLIVNSAFVAGTMLLILEIAKRQRSTQKAAALSPWIYLSSWVVSQCQLAGLVDSAETFFVTAFFLLSLSRERSWKKYATAAVLAFVGSFAKETTSMFMAICAVVTMLYRAHGRIELCRWSLTACTAGSSVLGTTLLFAVSPHTGDAITSSIHPLGVLVELFRCIFSRTNIYAFGVILPLALRSRTLIPRGWWIRGLSMAGVALFLGAVTAIEGNASRPLWSVLGPVLSIAAAHTVSKWS